MIMKRKRPLVWDRWNREHIKKHAITVSEIEEGYHLRNRIKVRVKNRRLAYIVKLKNGRLIMIIISFEEQENPYVVSARDAGAKERRIYYEKIQKT